MGMTITGQVQNPTEYKTTAKQVTTPEGLKPQQKATQPQEKILAEPQLPKTIVVQHKVEDMETLTTIATKYHTSVAKLKELNGMTNDRLKIGQSLKVETYDEKEYAQYKSDLKAYETQQLALWEADQAQKNAEAKQRNINAGEAGIAKAIELGYDQYDIRLEKDKNGKETGNVIIKMNEDVQIGVMKRHLGLANKVLYNYNTKKIEGLGTKEIGDSGNKSHDMVDAPKGMEFVIPGGNLNPQEKAWHEKIVDWFKNLF